MGNPAVALGVVKQSTANPLEVSDAVQEAAAARLPTIMPEGMKIDVGYDSSVFISKSIENVFHTIIEAIVLVVIVIFVFLRSLRATLMPLVTIPVSLIGAFIFMWMFGFSINTLTLLALVLAVGLVVDDAIVMLENISRHVEHGMPPVKAAFRGAREIAFAVIAMTITLAAVYAPIGFQTGRTGRLFTEFAWTLAGAVLISGFVALTLSPMMCSKLLRHQERHNFLYRWIEGGAERPHPWLSGSRPLGVGAQGRRGGAGHGRWSAAFGVRSCSRQLPPELSPIEDRGTIVALGIAPEGSTAAYTDHYVKRMEEIFRETPFVERFFTVIGFSGVTQGDQLHRAWSTGSSGRSSQQDITASPVSQAVRDPGPARLRLEPAVARPEPDRQAGPVRAADLAALRGAAGSGRPAHGGGPAESGAAESRHRPQAQQAAAQGRRSTARRRRCSGIDVETIGRTVETMLGGRQVTRFKREGKQYDVIVQLKDVDRTNPDDLREIFVRGSDGKHGGPLQPGAPSTRPWRPKELNHFNKLRSATLTATLAPGYSMGEALAFLDGRRPPRCRPGSSPTSTGRAASSAAPAAASTSPSCWRWRSSIWCWRRSSRA